MPMLAAAWSHAWQHGATCVNKDFLTVLGDVSPRGIQKSMPTHVAASMQPHASTYISLLFLDDVSPRQVGTCVQHSGCTEPHVSA